MIFFPRNHEHDDELVKCVESVETRQCYLLLCQQAADFQFVQYIQLKIIVNLVYC